MTSTGIVRRVDDLGRIVIPKEIRARFDIIEGTPLELCVVNDGIYLKKYYSNPENEIKCRIDNLELKMDKEETLEILNELIDFCNKKINEVCKNEYI